MNLFHKGVSGEGSWWNSSLLLQWLLFSSPSSTQRRLLGFSLFLWVPSRIHVEKFRKKLWTPSVSGAPRSSLYLGRVSTNLPVTLAELFLLAASCPGRAVLAFHLLPAGASLSLDFEPALWCIPEELLFIYFWNFMIIVVRLKLHSFFSSLHANVETSQKVRKKNCQGYWGFT